MRRLRVPVLALAAALLALPAGASARPQIVSAQLEGNPLVGRPLSLIVVARDADRPVTGLLVKLPDGRVFGESACLIGRDGRAASNATFGPGRQVRFKLPYTPDRAGVQVVETLVTSGGCGTQAEETAGRGVAVTVTLPAYPAVPPTATLPTIPGLPPIARVTAAGCSGAHAVPTARTARSARAATLCLINQQRRGRGLPSLRSNTRLRRAATRHTSDMLRRRFFGHSGPRGPDLASRLRRVRYWPAVAAENLGRGGGATPAAIVSTWMNSDIHRMNILTSSFRQAGIGIAPGTAGGGPAGATYTVDFGRR